MLRSACANILFLTQTTVCLLIHSGRGVGWRRYITSVPALIVCSPLFLPSVNILCNMVQTMILQPCVQHFSLSVSHPQRKNKPVKSVAVATCIHSALCVLKVQIMGHWTSPMKTQTNKIPCGLAALWGSLTRTICLIVGKALGYIHTYYRWGINLH